MNKIKILITSVGSLVGLNILDTLGSRRHLLEVIGCNIHGKDPYIFRCDRIYKVSSTTNRDFFISELFGIILREKPDLVLPGRDDDAVILSLLRELHPELNKVIPCGKPKAAEIMQDKLSSYEFAKEHGLPFAETIEIKPDNKSFIANYAEGIGFPMIAKLRYGYASKGVFFVRNLSELDKLFESSEYFVIQEYLDPNPEIDNYLEQYHFLPPLFFQVPENTQYAAQCVISPAGEMSRIFISVNKMVLGRCERSEIIENKEIEKVTLSYAKAFYKAGWCGSLNIQLKPDKTGKWKALEFNPRMTGSTSARYLMGFDEVGIIFDYFKPELRFPNHSLDIPPGKTVTRQFMDILEPEQDKRLFEENKIWEKSS